MHNLAVHWHEGLFLRPQHLQAWDRHWHETSTASERWQSPYSYGLAQIAINADALAAGFFQLDAVRAKLLDGMLVELAPGEGTQRVDLRPAFAKLENDEASTISMQGSAGLDVFLAVPRLQLGGCNVAETPTDGVARFLPLQQQVPDDSDGTSVEPILFRRVNAKLLLSTDDTAGYETLKIARVVRRNTGGAWAALDVRYIPPLLDCAAWPAMRQLLLRPIFDLVASKANVLAQLLTDHSLDASGRSLADLQRIMTLQALNQAAAVTSVLAQAGGVSPLIAYLELAKVAGSLDLLAPDHRFEPVPPYDHEALGAVFGALRNRIEKRLRLAAATPYQQRYFTGFELGADTVGACGMQLSLPSEWFQPACQRIFAVHRGDLTPQEIESLLLPGHLDWKLGSASQVGQLFQQRTGGVEVTPLRRVPKALPSPAEWSFFALEEHGPAWSEVQRTRSLAICLRQNLVANAAGLNGNKSLQIRLQRRTVTLQFACFAVGLDDG